MRHDDMLRDDVAALAAGALSPAEAGALLAHLDECEDCREEYREAVAGLDVLLAGVEREAAELRVPYGDALRDRVFAEARSARPPRDIAHRAVVASDALIPLADGVDWAVVAQPGMTLVYWVFTPPACRELPLESHAQAQAGFVLDGALEFHYGDGGRETVRSGAFYAIAPNTIHGATILERTVLVDVYTPNMSAFERRYAEQRRSPG